MAMANPEHVQLVKKGAGAIQKWREENPAVRLDLSQADLTGVNLSGANLAGATLSGATLSRADLGGANLSEASLYGAILKETNLRGADLHVADLAHADLTKANVSHANLSVAELGETNLDGASLRGANLSRANLSTAHIRRGLIVLDPMERSFNKMDWINADPCTVDLSEANMSGAYFDGADLRGMQLVGARLSGADLSGANLTGTVLSAADLTGANLSRAKIDMTDLAAANLSGANLGETDIRDADLSNTILVDADLHEADLFMTSFRGADLTRADLRFSRVLRVDFTKAVLVGCRIHGVSVWGAMLTEATQKDLLITVEDEPTITVDGLEVAQFLYVLLRNEKIRGVLDVITRKVVLILGRFTPERKAVLDAIRERLRKHQYVPVMFDFDKPANRSFVETVSTLAHLARFIIADFTDPKIVLQEVEHVVSLLAVPIKPILLQGSEEPVALLDARKGRTYVLDTYF
jgi:uncharacterized protein YjbI with pentapeptide repeats